MYLAELDSLNLDNNSWVQNQITLVQIEAFCKSFEHFLRGFERIGLAERNAYQGDYLAHF